jgi:hypothetical protein
VRLREGLEARVTAAEGEASAGLGLPRLAAAADAPPNIATCSDELHAARHNLTHTVRCVFCVSSSCSCGCVYTIQLDERYDAIGMSGLVCGRSVSAGQLGWLDRNA